LRTLCSSTLISEFFVIGFAGLVAMKHPDLSQATVWTVCGIAMALCLALCAMLGRPGAIAVGWVLQAALIAGGVVIATMYFLGAVFAVLWWASVHYGRKVDVIRAGHEAAAQQPSQPSRPSPAA
jgi:hypothetical protein